MNAAKAARDWKGVLAWEGRLEELLEGLAGPRGCSDATCEGILAVFCTAHVEMHHKDNARAAIGLLERRVELLGKMERFRDQGQRICEIAYCLECLGREEEARKEFQRARDVGAAHGFFSVECLACVGLGHLAMTVGRDEEGVELYQNAVAAARVSGDGDISLSQERSILCMLIEALFETKAIDEVEPHLLRYREMVKAESQSNFPYVPAELKAEVISARLHEVPRIRIPM